MRALVALCAGLLFAVGLALAGMTQPSKVLAFLDVTGDWNPSLLFVMVGAIAVYTLAYRWSLRLPRPLLGPSFSTPSSTRFDLRLVLGAVMFGIGWGLAGYCPGPAIASIGAGGTQVAGFVAAMLAGTALVQLLDRSAR